MSNFLIVPRFLVLRESEDEAEWVPALFTTEYYQRFAVSDELNDLASLLQDGWSMNDADPYNGLRVADTGSGELYALHPDRNEFYQIDRSTAQNKADQFWLDCN